MSDKEKLDRAVIGQTCLNASAGYALQIAALGVSDALGTSIGFACKESGVSKEFAIQTLKTAFLNAESVIDTIYAEDPKPANITRH